MPFRLIVPKQIYAEMVAQAIAELPNECCGLLAGAVEECPDVNGSPVRIGRVVKGYPLVNEAQSGVEFLSQPESMFAAMRDMNKHLLDTLAVYHSHPTSPPVPSKTDLARNYSPEVMNLIISLTASPPVVRAWWLTELEYREAEWGMASSEPEAGAKKQITASEPEAYAKQQGTASELEA